MIFSISVKQERGMTVEPLMVVGVYFAEVAHIHFSSLPVIPYKAPAMEKLEQDPFLKHVTFVFVKREPLVSSLKGVR